jgi:pilus assembly protein Flp/PilA
MRRFFSIIKDEKAATAVEYGLILALVFLAMIGGLSAFASSAINMWDYVAATVETS